MMILQSPETSGVQFQVVKLIYMSTICTYLKFTVQSLKCYYVHQLLRTEGYFLLSNFLLTC